MTFAGFVFWDGVSWRDYRPGDELLAKIIIGERLQGSGMIDPRMTMLLPARYKGVARAFHKRWLRNNGNVDN